MATSSRIRYRLAKPKPNIITGKRVVQFAPGSGSSAVSSQRGPLGQSGPELAPQTSISSNISATPKETDSLEENSSAQRLTSLNVAEPEIEERGKVIDSVINKQTITVSSPVKTPENATLKPSDKENVEDSITTVSPAEISPAKPRERRMSVREVEKESTRNRYKKGAAPPERDKMTMLDLIYWNPSNNPMIEEDCITSNEVNKGLDADQRRIEESVDDPENCGDSEVEKNQSTRYGAMDEDDEESMPVPQVKIGPDGNIILDEQSLVIQTSAAKKGISSAPAVQERSSLITYNSFRKRKQSKIWSDSETSRFYMALSTFGTDFSMMLSKFPNRQRHELKLKYKREEKYNKELVDKAIHEAYQYDLTIIDEHKSESENQVEVKKRKTSTKRKKPSIEENSKDKSKADLHKRRKPRLQEESDTEIDEPDENILSENENQLPCNPQQEQTIAKESHIKNKKRKTSIKKKVPAEINKAKTNIKRKKTLSEDESQMNLMNVIESVASSKDEVENLKNDNSSNDDDAEVSMVNILKTTRSGRQPKQRLLYSNEKNKNFVNKELTSQETISNESMETNSAGTESAGIAESSDALEHSYATSS